MGYEGELIEIGHVVDLKVDPGHTRVEQLAEAVNDLSWVPVRPSADDRPLFILPQTPAGSPTMSVPTVCRR